MNSKIIIFIFIMVFSGILVQAKIPDIERQALIALYNSTNGDNWYRKDNWEKADGSFNDPGTENTWYGITCDEGNNKVVSIKLEYNGLSEKIPEELVNLVNLKNLDLSSNYFPCHIPSFLGELKNLENLDFSNMSFVGGIPESFVNLTNLKRLALYENDLLDIIPSFIGSLKKLEYLNLCACDFKGEIPKSLGKLFKLKELSLDDNDLTGSIPSTLGELINLKYLYLESNNLSGKIPASLGKLIKLESLDLWGNNLEGEIPKSIGQLENLIYLSLYENNLSGEIPREIGHLKKLSSLYLNHNNLVNPIPEELTGLGNLISLGLSDNNFSGKIPAFFGKIKNLGCIELGMNFFSGKVPKELANLPNMCDLFVDGNKLSGKIPENFIEYNDNPCCCGDPGIIINSYNSLTCSRNLQWVASDFDLNFQTLPPTDVQVFRNKDNYKVKWVPIKYTTDSGCYQIFYSQKSGGPYTYLGSTVDKTSNSYVIDVLPSSKNYYFVVRTKTNPHKYNKNTVISDFSPEAEMKNATKSISGMITHKGAPVPGVIIKGFMDNIVSDKNGFYQGYLFKGWSGTIKAEKEGWVFLPPEISINNVQNDITGQDFTAYQKLSVQVQAFRQTEKAWIVKRDVGKIIISGQNPSAYPDIKCVLYRKTSQDNNYTPIFEASPSGSQWNYTHYDKYLANREAYTYKAMVYNKEGEIMSVSQEITI